MAIAKFNFGADCAGFVFYGPSPRNVDPSPRCGATKCRSPPVEAAWRTVARLLPIGGPVREIAELDVLRAVAMTMVIAHHCGLLPMGWMGVWLFFVISGYVISRSITANRGRFASKGDHVVAYLSRRFYRIAPAYFFYLLVSGIIAIGLGLDVVNDLPFLASFTFNWQRTFELLPRSIDWYAFGHLWSLSVEAQFYFVAPTLLLGLSKKAYVVTISALVVLGPLTRFGYSLLVQQLNHDPEWVAFNVFSSSFAHFDAFLIGALIAHFEPFLKERKALLPHAFAVGSIAIVATYMAAYAMVNHGQGASGLNLLRNIVSGTLYGQGREVFVYTVASTAAGVAVLYAVTGGHVMRRLAHPFVVHLGRISYGAYLFHALVIWIIGAALATAPVAELEIGHRLFWFVIAWLATTGAAWLSYRWLESPIIEWSRVDRRSAESLHNGRIVATGWNQRERDTHFT